METALIAILIAILANVLFLIREKRLRRVSESKLQIAKIVTELEKMMLSGKIKAGELSHDAIYQSMRLSQHQQKPEFFWAIWKIWGNDVKEARQALTTELQKQSEISPLYKAYIQAEFRVFRNLRPYTALCFMLWVIFFCGGLLILLGALVGVFKARRAAIEGWEKFKAFLTSTFAQYAIPARQVTVAK